MNEYLWSKGYPLPYKSKEGETLFDYFLEEKKGTLEWKLVSPDEWIAPEKL